MTTAIFIITSNNNNNRLIWDILSSPAPESTQWQSDCLQLTQFTQLSQGGSKVRRLVKQLLWERSAQNYIILTGTSEQPDLRKGILKQGLKKKHWVDFYHYRTDVYTHFQHIFPTWKVNFASDDPFKLKYSQSFIFTQSDLLCCDSSSA